MAEPSVRDWELAAIACREVAELGDRDSCEHMTPDDMLVTGDELQRIVAAACAAARDAGRREERERCAKEIAGLRQDVIAFCGPWAATYAHDHGLPDGHLHPAHYDILARCGARMDDFTRCSNA